MADIFTKPLKKSILIYLQRKLYGWLNIKSENFASTLGSIIIQTKIHQIKTYNGIKLKWKFIFKNPSVIFFV